MGDTGRVSPRPVTLIAGDSDERVRLEQLAHELELEDIIFLGHQGQHTLIALANIADVGAFPSRRNLSWEATVGGIERVYERALG
jgi:glycosyltransferase involved in cell wall biosynthesis